MFNYFKTVKSVAGVGNVVEYWNSEASARAVAGAKVYGEADENVWVEV